MILNAFEKCPICSRAGYDNSWKEINYNSGWWEKMCDNYHHRCKFTQHYWQSFNDPTLRYIHFGLHNFYCYTYSESTAHIIAGTYFYHNKFPRREVSQGPFQIWPDFIPDWDNLDKLNDKLKLYKIFQ
jgi:hypothetical protein